MSLYPRIEDVAIAFDIDRDKGAAVQRVKPLCRVYGYLTLILIRSN